MAGSAIGLLAGVSVKCVLFAFLVKNVKWLVFGFSKPKSETHFLPAVLRTNLYTFLLLALTGAIYALPQRLSHPAFLLLDK